MLRLPPLKTKSLIVVCVAGSSLLLLARALNGSGGGIKTVESALLIALASLTFPAICFGSLYSAFIKDLLFEPSEELKKTDLTLLFVGVLSTWISLSILNQAWGLFHQAQR